LLVSSLAAGSAQSWARVRNFMSVRNALKLEYEATARGKGGLL